MEARPGAAQCTGAWLSSPWPLGGAMGIQSVKGGRVVCRCGLRGPYLCRGFVYFTAAVGCTQSPSSTFADGRLNSQKLWTCTVQAGSWNAMSAAWLVVHGVP